MSNDQPALPKTSVEIPPPYTQSSCSPLVLTETTTTRTEVVTTTTTTTQTTTHFFSLPYFRKRAGPSHQSSKDDYSNHNISAPQLSDIALFEKVLPPTPPNEIGSQNEPMMMDSTQDLPTSSPVAQRADIVHATSPLQAHSVAAPLTRTSLGKGFPRPSLASYPETNTIPFVSSVSPIPVEKPTVRKSRSFQWLKRNVSENYTPSHDDLPHHSVSERHRGSSLGASSFLNIEVPSDGDTRRPTDFSSSSPKVTTKTVSRRASFWSKRRGSHSKEPSNHPSDNDGIILTLPPLPPVYHVSPFNISHLTEAPSPFPTRMTEATHAPPFSDPSCNVEPCETDTPLPRPRAQTNPSNPPFFRRFSVGIFSALEPSSPLDLHSNNSAQSLVITPTVARQAVHKPVIPKPLSKEESPDIYLTRLQSAVSKAEVAGILASSPDPFYVEALRSYINQFNFLGIPLDIALRKLLMEVGLPHETQQIDRVIEAFAFRYTQCNPGFFPSEDNAYVLAFSLIMLHTDAFNPSNKRKMTKQDYIKNTRLPGVPIELLDYLFDNVVFAPFIFIEDPVDVNGQFGLTPDVTRTPINSPTSVISPSATTFKIGNKVDPYYLIANNLLGPLRVDVERYIPLENPYTYEGTNGPWNEQELHRAFVRAKVIEIDSLNTDRPSTIFSLSPSDNPGAPVSNANDLPSAPSSKGKTRNLNITKCGLLNRKDDISEGGKKTMSRKWKSWGVVLTGSQLLFFRDSTWTSTLQTLSTDSPAHHAIPSTILRPDELFSLKDSIAVCDRSYTKYQHVLRFILPDGRHLLLQACDENDLNEWISRINYASAFRSAGVRMRPLELTCEDVHLTGVAAATSYLHDIQHSHYPGPHYWGPDAAHDLMDMLSVQQIGRSWLERRVTMANNHPNFELDIPVAPEVEGAEQFKATFDEVKADLDLADTHRQPLDKASCLPSDNEDVPADDSPCASPKSASSRRLPSRSHIIQSKIRDFDSRITALRAQLDTDSRCIRNIAVLTPFRKSTRSRLLVAIQNMAKRVMQVRLDMARLTCYRFVLHCDLASESRLWEHSKQFALRSAKETLQNKHIIPRMTLSLHDGQPRSDALAPEEHLPNSKEIGPDSSICGSFRSAVDLGLVWLSSEDLTLLSPSQLHDSPGPSFSTSISSFLSLRSPAPSSSEQVWRQSYSSSSNSHPESGQQDDRNDLPRDHDVSSEENEEQAEEWNQTRCSQRVSLVHVPADIRSRLQHQPLGNGV